MSDWIREANLALDGWLPALAVLAAGLVLGWIGRTVLFRRLRRLAKQTSTRVDDALLDASRGLWMPITLCLATLAALRLAPLEDDYQLLGERLATFGLLVALTLCGSRFVGHWFQGVDRDERGLPAQPSLIAKAVRGTVVIIGGMLAMQSAGYPIAPLLTALGIGSLAVGLALQPTLSNFFAGIYLSTSKPIRVGDFIELEDGTQGEVVDIGWRATKVRQIANNLAIVPNSRLGEMRILNYSQPEMPQAAIVTVGVAYGSDLERVERVAMEVAQEVQRDRPEADAGHDPTVRFHTFGASSIDFNVVLRARTVVDRPPLVHEYVKRIKARFDAEGIEIPFPQRVVHLPAGAPAPPPPAAG
ncbi:MAG: mechanosensitive ion channel family protein [Thermoanaerobaculia bacterium]|nr:mechanosensitive ion channel family protein [Thermoanaerobaculia bacterium]